MAEVFDVFISYRRKDGEDIAKDLYGFLSQKGVRVFLDKEKLEVGKNFPDQLRDAIKKAPHYVLVGTKSAFDFRAENAEVGELDFVKEEIRTALAYRDTDRTVTVYVPANEKLPKREETSSDVRGILDQNNIVQTSTQDQAFEIILGVVTAVSRTNLWYGAGRWLENGKKPGGRFARLRIDESIMPAASEKKDREELPIEVITDKENGTIVPLLDAIKNTKGNLYLIGEGGIGKTTSLIHIMEEAYGKDYSQAEQIPIFVELSFAPDKSGKWIEPRKSTFIFRSIYKQIIDRRSEEQGSVRGVEELDEVFGMDPAVAVNPVKDLFTRESPSPEYLLLLDGLNEVSPAKIKGGDEMVIGLVLQEIRYITENCHNVRVILTSRSDESAVSFDGFTRIYLSGVDDNDIEKYLIKKGLPEERIKSAKVDKELMKTLRVPLFLTMYADLKDTVGISTQGEILHAFFNERRVNISAYTAQKRLTEIGTNFVYSEPSVDKARLSADMQIFILDLILPQIGHEMEKNGLYYISPLKLYGPILDVINGNKITDECGRYGRYVFPVVCKDGTEKSPKAIVKSMLDAFDGDEDEVCEAILDCLVKSLGLFQITNGEYGFIHQHFRDYFSAVKYILVMKLSAALLKDGEKEEALGLMNAYFKDKPASLQIRRFIGEITGEHHNKPFCENKIWKLPQKESLVMKALDIYRGADQKNAGYGVYSLIHILNEARGDLSGCDFSRLDFSGCNINGMRLSRNGLQACFDNAVLNYDRLDFLGHISSIYAAAFSSDGKRIVTASRDTTVKIWDANSFDLIWVIKGHSRSVNSVSYSPDGKSILTSSDDGIVKIWDAESFELLGTINEESWPGVNSASFSPKGKRIVTTSNDHMARIWDAGNFELLGTLEGHSRSVASASYSPDGKRIVTASDDKTAKIWDADSFKLLGTLKGHSNRVISASYSLDGKRIITASYDNTAKVWDADSFELLGTLEGHSNHVISASYSPDGKRIVTSSFDYTVKLWDAENFKILGTLKGHSRSVHSASYSSDGKRIVTASADKAAKIWDAKNFHLIGTIEGHLNWVESAFYSPDSKHIVTASLDGVVKIWDTENYKLLGTLEGHSDRVALASYTHDGRCIITSSYDKIAKIWDACSFELIKELKDYSIQEILTECSSDGKRTVVVSDDQTVYILDYGMTPIGILEGHSDHINAVSYSPDGKRVVTAPGNTTAEIWENYKLLGTLEGHSRSVNSVSYSPDGKHIVTASDDGTVKIWNAERIECIETIENIPGLNFVGVDFTRLDPRSKISNEEKEIIRRYGGII